MGSIAFNANPANRLSTTRNFNSVNTDNSKISDNRKTPTLNASNHSTIAQSTDLGEALEQEKSLSLAFQLMLAIARENEANSNDSTHISKLTNALDSFNLDMQYEAIQEVSFAISQQELSSQNQFSLDFQYEQTQTFEISFIDPVNDIELDIELKINISRESQFNFSASFEPVQTEKSDPLILNLDNSDFDFKPSQLITFDLNADGSLDKITNLASGNAFLAFDKNANGFIDDGSELFGDTGGSIDGFADLAQYDTNSDGQINAQDKIFENLLLMNFDANGAQTTQALSSENIESLSLSSESKNEGYEGDNLLVSQSDFKRIDGSLGRIGDFLLSIS